ncbi:MAG: archease [bacterium]|nr:archease [bacterium]
MAGGYKELDGITADLGLEAWGETLEEAFVQAGLGLAAVMADLPTEDDKVTRTVLVQAPSPQDLLIRFLNEIIYREDTEGFIPVNVPSLEIVGGRLEATLTGMIYDPSRHIINTHVKAATYHGLAIEETPGEVRVRVIFDV